MATETSSALPSPEARRRPARAARLWLRRVRVDRVLVLFAAVAAMTLLLVETPVAASLHGIPVIVAFVLAAAHTAAIPLALRAPRIAGALAIAASLVMQGLSATTSAIWPWWPTLIVTQTLVLGLAATRITWPIALTQWLVSIGASSLLAAILRPVDDGRASVNLVVFGAVCGSTVLVAQLIAQWRLLRGELLHERAVAAEEVQRRQLMEERTRIARELHDVVAHSMSIITVQSSTARFRNPTLNDDAGDEFDRIGDLSRQALEEMRGLLRVLRGSEDEPMHRPQPGLGDLPDLVATAARAGADVTIEPIRTGVEISEVTGAAAYRIAQEAVSNALRHAPGAAVAITCRIVTGRLMLSVTNAAPIGPIAMPAQVGHGLIGMSERAESVGGSVTAAPTDDGGFAVRAVLPLRIPRMVR